MKLEMNDPYKSCHSRNIWFCNSKRLYRSAYMTEAFPNVGHYRNLLSATADPNLKPRPTLEELHGDKVNRNTERKEVKGVIRIAGFF